MRVAINCRSILNQQLTGIGRYTYNLIKSYTEIDYENEYLLYVPKNPFQFKRQIPKFTSSRVHAKVDWFKRGLNKTLGKVDIYHSPCPDVFHIDGAKKIVTIHDLVYKAFPQGHTETTLKLTDKQMLSFLPDVSRLICVSQNTANDLVKYFNVDRSKIRVVYQGVDGNIFYPVAGEELEEAKKIVKAKGVESPFLLFVGTIEPRKNLKNLFQAMAYLKMKNKVPGKLVVIGMKGWKEDAIMNELANLNIGDDIQFMGFLSNDELRCFYNLAEALIFPSFYEGFGYPIIEAFSCGTAVISSNASSCPEIAGDTALMINPEDPEEIAEAILNIAEDVKLKAECQEKSLKKAEEFSTEKTALETLEVYAEVARES